MSVVRINEFRVLEARREELLSALRSVLPAIKQSAGCLSCQLLENETNLQHLVIIETWTSHEAHRAAAQSIPTDLLHRAMTMLSEVPSGTYFRDIS